MSQGTANRIAFNTAAQTVLRILIASYFIAVAVQIIPGTNLGALFSPLLPAPFDSATAAGIVFILSFMVIIGSGTRGAALIIALMTFYASYLAMVDLGVDQELGAFWRDLALIAALLLTYSEPQAGTRHRRRILNRSIAPRRIDMANRVVITPRAPRPAPAMNLAALKVDAVPAADFVEPEPVVSRSRPEPRVTRDDPAENIFAEDFAWN